MRLLLHFRGGCLLLPLGFASSRLWRRRLNRSTRMTWEWALISALIGFLITKRPWGAVIGLIIGYAIRQAIGVRAGGAGYAADSGGISEVFFRTTFELMGHVAKSDGRVSEA